MTPMADEPNLPNPDISFPERLLILLFAGGLDFIKFILGPIPFIDLFGIVIFLIGAALMWTYFILRVGFKSVLGGPKRIAKIMTAIATTALGIMPFFGDFIPELLIECGATFFFIGSENSAARKNAPRPGRPVPTRRAL